MGSTADRYDFIVVGGGTAGCLLAYRLAHAPTAPSVLVIERGGENLQDYLYIPAERYTTAVTSGIDPGYVSTPQEQLNGKEIPYMRGTGLGGTSTVNMLQFSRGADADWNEWARLVGDDTWKWENTKQRFKRIENHHDKTPKDWKKYVSSNEEDHGFDGPIDVGFPAKWEKRMGIFFDSVAEAGYHINPDHNSGNVIGWSVSVSATDGQSRTTSASNTMRKRPQNLQIRTNTQVAKVIVENGVAVGVLTLDGTKIFASRDVILSAGALDSPKILLLSGIGPSAELSSLEIPVTHNLPGIGKNFKDHTGSFIVHQVDGSFSDRDAAIQAASEAGRLPRERWREDTTGWYADHLSNLALGYFHDESLLVTPEFQQLNLETRTYLTKKGVPAYELVAAIPNMYPGFDAPDQGSTTHIVLVFVHNAQSTGSVTLRSKDPADKPAVDIQYLSHPYDQQVVIHGLREARKVLEGTGLRKFKQRDLAAPASDRDEDILAYARAIVAPGLHANGTVKMGPPSDPTACVDTEFRVYGVQNLRVVDLSVCPMTPNAHTLGPAYLIAETAADKLIAQYRL